MIKRTEGVVLKNFPFGEADLIVTYLSYDYGLLKVFAKGSRKIKSRFGSSLEPLTYSKISFIGKEGANLPRLIQSDIIHSFQKLREDFRFFQNISEIIELSLKLLPEYEANFEAFKLLKDILLKLEADGNKRLYYLYFTARFLEIMGYSPRLDTCGRCGKSNLLLNNTLSSHLLYMSDGLVYCDKCIEDNNNFVALSKGVVRFYISLLRWRQSMIDRIRVPDNLLTESFNLIKSHVSYILIR